MTQTQKPKPRTRFPLTQPQQAIDLCERLQEVAARMTDLLARETAMLENNRPQEISLLSDEKAALSQAYAKDYGVFKANYKFVGATAPAQTDRLRRVLKVLEAEVQRNFTALEATRAVSEGLMNAIFEIAKSKRSGLKRYTNSASVAQSPNGAPMALAIDRSL